MNKCSSKSEAVHLVASIDVFSIQVHAISLKVLISWQRLGTKERKEKIN